MYEKFAALLKRDGKSAYRVSKDTGVRKSAFTDWKNGRSKPKFDKLLILARYFNVPVEYFADEPTESPEKPETVPEGK